MASLKLPVDSDLSTPDGEPVSVEYIDPANPAAYSQENAFIQRSGNHSDGVRQSFHLLFKKGATLSGTPRWDAAKTGSGSSATSAIFPGSPVTSFARLVVRRPSSDAYADGLGSTEGSDIYIRDLWLKETQRATGGFTAQRRWVHLYLNGLYWGLYDLEEHHDEDMISDHLKAKAASGYAAGSLAPDKILFLSYTLDSSSLEAQNAWDSLVSACSAARLDPGNAGLYAQVENKLDVQDYISYIITSATCGKGDDYRLDQVRGWRHPDQRWHLIQWDGDSIKFKDDADMLVPCANMYQSTMERRFLPTISLQIDYLAPAPLGAWVQGQADVLRTTRNMLFGQGLVTADGEPTMRMSGIFKMGQLLTEGSPTDPLGLKTP